MQFGDASIQQYLLIIHFPGFPCPPCTPSQTWFIISFSKRMESKCNSMTSGRESAYFQMSHPDQCHFPYISPLQLHHQKEKKKNSSCYSTITLYCSNSSNYQLFKSPSVVCQGKRAAQDFMTSMTTKGLSWVVTGPTHTVGWIRHFVLGRKNATCGWRN